VVRGGRVRVGDRLAMSAATATPRAALEATIARLSGLLGS
jgi:hypothetical protein